MQNREYVHVDGESFQVRYCLKWKDDDDITNLCDDKDEIELDWLEMVNDEYERSIREYLRAPNNKKETVDEMREHERYLLDEARKSVIICRILYKE